MALKIEIPQYRDRINYAYWLTLIVVILLDGVLQLFSQLLYFLPALGLILTPVTSWILSLYNNLTVVVWAQNHDVFFTESVTKFLLMFLVSIAEWTPLVNGAPWWTIGFILLGLIVKSDDYLYNKKIKIKRQKVAQFIEQENIEAEHVFAGQQALARNKLSASAIARATRRAANDNRSQPLRNIRMRPQAIKNIQYQAANSNNAYAAAA